jgi:uncharacterized membrane protein
MVSEGSSVGRSFGSGHRGGKAPRNVGENERMISMVAGAALTMFGLRRRSIGGLLLAGLGAGLFYRGMSGRCSLYGSVGIGTREEAQPNDYFEHGIHVEEGIAIDKSPEELFRFWRNLENLPKFMKNLRSVEVYDDHRSRWVAAGLGGKRVEWEAEIINEERDHLIAWRTLPGADIQHTGSVRFVKGPAGLGTQVRVTMEYLPPAGRIGVAIARLFNSAPDQEIHDDLRRLKHLIETGEAPMEQGRSRGGRVQGRPTPADKSRPADLKASAGKGPRKDPVQEASEESFPASDAPGWGSSSAG